MAAATAGVQLALSNLTPGPVLDSEWRWPLGLAVGGGAFAACRYGAGHDRTSAGEDADGASGHEPQMTSPREAGVGVCAALPVTAKAAAGVRRGVPTPVLGLALLAVSLVLAIQACAASKPRVALTVVNGSDYLAKVEVTGDKGHGWLGIVTVRPRSEASVTEVLDQGATWRFRFTYSSHSELLTLPRTELEASGWRVDVPAAFGQQLRAMGVAPVP
jgi:hypothetical protein